MRARLFLLAHGRSGDKGDIVNIGVIARRPEWYRFLATELSEERVAQHLAGLARGPVRRYELPHLDAFNFVVRNALGGGGAVTLRLDAQGKTYAQALFLLWLELPPWLEDAVRAHWADRLPSDCVERVEARP